MSENFVTEKGMELEQKLMLSSWGPCYDRSKHVVGMTWIIVWH